MADIPKVFVWFHINNKKAKIFDIMLTTFFKFNAFITTYILILVSFLKFILKFKLYLYYIHVTVNIYIMYFKNNTYMQKYNFHLNEICVSRR